MHESLCKIHVQLGRPATKFRIHNKTTIPVQIFRYLTRLAHAGCAVLTKVLAFISMYACPGPDRTHLVQPPDVRGRTGHERERSQAFVPRSCAYLSSYIRFLYGKSLWFYFISKIPDTHIWGITNARGRRKISAAGQIFDAQAILAHKTSFLTRFTLLSQLVW